jgi:hypothetical protein
MMAWGTRALLRRLPFAVLVVMAASSPMACGALLGIDPGIPFGSDASVETGAGEGGGSSVADSTVEAAGDAASSDGGVLGDGGTDVSDSESSIDSGGTQPDGEADAHCTSEVTWCNTHCGTGPDNCQQTVTCSGCDPGDTCNTQNLCVCVPKADYCVGRCGKTVDNCNNGIDCGGCDGGACTANACGCVPESATQACGKLQCGQATDNCNLTVNCGVNNTTDCPTGEDCLRARAKITERHCVS